LGQDSPAVRNANGTGRCLTAAGALDFGYLPGGELRIDSVWWKGVYGSSSPQHP
jgi:hypothetical protein